MSTNTKDELRNEYVLVEMFHNHYMNIVEKSSGSAPKPIGNPSNPDLDSNAVADIIEYYKSHPSIMQIKKTFKHSNSSDFPEAKIKGINSIIQYNTIKYNTVQ